MRVGIIGCGVVGAAIAYTLSQGSDTQVWVWDQRSPHQYEATGAALGVLMAVVSSKLKGRHGRLRLDSLRHYESLIPKLQAQLGLEIPYNRQGILKLCFSSEELQRWQTVKAARQDQGFKLELLSREQWAEPDSAWPQPRAFDLPAEVQGVVYSPQDRQVDPVALTEALVAGAERQGAQIHFETKIQTWGSRRIGSQEQVLTHVCTAQGEYALDGLVVAAGLGSVPLAAQCQHPIPMQPVLGQALRLRLPRPWPHPHPVISGHDIHLVPLSPWELWVGATVEFPPEQSPTPRADPQQLDQLYQGAIALCPALADAQVLHSWSGLRPRPVGQAAPVIERLTPYTNVILASGHYRNGVLLAPITAIKVQQFFSP